MQFEQTTINYGLVERHDGWAFSRIHLHIITPAQVDLFEPNVPITPVI
jgi:hypothetical protein